MLVRIAIAELVALGILAACRPAAVESASVLHSANTLRVVHVAWPGRAASDAMDREVFSDARVRARIARLTFERLEHDAVAGELRALLDGVGTIVFCDGTAVARRRGVASARAWLAFLDAAVVAARRTSDLDGRSDAAARRDRARIALDSGFPERALELLSTGGEGRPEDAYLRIEAWLARGDVAATRQAIDALPIGSVPLLSQARLLLAERRAKAVIELVEALPSADPDVRLVLAAALLELGRRSEGQAILRELCARPDGTGAAADALLDGSFRDESGHSHR